VPVRLFAKKYGYYTRAGIRLERLSFIPSRWGKEEHLVRLALVLPDFAELSAVSADCVSS
jgi:hypothetical protein